jgi:hypothetical protein
MRKRKESDLVPDGKAGGKAGRNVASKAAGIAGGRATRKAAVPAADTLAGKAGVTMARTVAGTEAGFLPDFCDYDCRHASFSAPEASGACRRDQAVWCMLFVRYNNKNARCLARPRKRP